MSKLDEYLKANREHAYKTAYDNTPRNATGQPVIPKDDEWREETEWDEEYSKMVKGCVST